MKYENQIKCPVDGIFLSNGEVNCFISFTDKKQSYGLDKNNLEKLGMLDDRSIGILCDK